MVASKNKICIAIVLGAFLLPTFIPVNFTHVQAQTSSDFLGVSGTKFTYRGNANVYLRGANIHNEPWLNGWHGSLSSIIITEGDYQKMAQMGGNHFRFGLAYGMWSDNAANDHKVFYDMLDQQIGWARKHNIWILLNLFSTPQHQESSGWHCNNLASQEQALGDFWVHVANRYKNEPVIAGYDIINEPGWCNTWDYWFDMAERIGQRVHTIDPNHLIFVSATDGATVNRKLNGNYFVYEPHDYEPGGGTHCQSMSQQYTYPGTFPMWGGDPNTYWDAAAMANSSSYASLHYNVPAWAWSKSNNVPLYIGEWGMASVACVKNAGQYETDKGTQYVKEGIHHAYYVWRHSINYWGIFPHSAGNFNPHYAEKYNAAVASFANAVRPNFSGTTPPPNPPPTNPPPTNPPPTNPPNNGSGIVISTPLSLTKTSLPATGGTISGSVTYKNNGTSSITVNNIVITARPPGGTNLGGPYYDFSPASGSITIQPGATYTLTASRALTGSDPTGSWFAFSTYNDASGWHDAETSQNKTFTVGTTTTKPTGCNADYNNNGTVDIADFQTFGQNYKISSIQCALDIVGGDCYLNIADFQEFGQAYKVANLCS